MRRSSDLRGVFTVLIDKIERKIHAHEREVDDIECKHVIELPIEDLARNTSQIADDDREHEYEAFALSGESGYALIHGHGP